MRKSQLLLAICLMLFPIDAHAATDCSGTLASDREQNLICLDTLIKQPKTEAKSWERFWAVYMNAEKEALKCDSLKFTSEFLRIGTQQLGTATLEAYDESIEKLLQEQTSCFFDSVLILNKTQRYNIIDKVLTGSSNMDQKAMDDIFKKKGSDMRYKEIVDIYNELRPKLKAFE